MTDCILLPLGSVGVHHIVFKKLLVTIAPWVSRCSSYNSMYFS
jgi:hypothetical protein